MNRYVVLWFDVVGGNYTVEVEGVDSVDEAVRRAQELGGIWLSAEAVIDVAQKIINEIRS